MIILIGGVSCSGKTLMAQKLVEKYKIANVSLDHLKMALYRSKQNCGYTPEDSDIIIAKKLQPIVKAWIMTAIENNQNLIMEGAYIRPSLLQDFESSYLEHIILIFIGFSKTYISNNFEEKIVGYRSIIEERINPEDRPESQFMIEHEQLKNECEEEKANYFEISENYLEEIQKVYDFIDEEMINKIGRGGFLIE